MVHGTVHGCMSSYYRVVCIRWLLQAKSREKDFRVVCGNASQVEQHTPFYAVKTLVARLLELESCHSAHEREHVIISKVSDTLKPDLPLLNELLSINVGETSCVLNS